MLTPREKQVLTLAVDLSNREIGLALGIALQTVKNHLTTIYRKLGVRGEHRQKRIPAILKAAKKGIIAL